MLDSRERTVAVAHHPTEIQPWPQMPYQGGTRSLSRDHRHHLEARAQARSSAIGAKGATAVTLRGELAQHGARSVAFARDTITTRQSAGRPPRSKE